LLSISSHYNTQLGLLSALQTGANSPLYRWQTKIPATAAVLVFELHTSLPAAGGSESSVPADSRFAVRAVFQDGPEAQYAVLQLPCAVAGDAAEQLAGPGSCTLGSFRALAVPRAFGSIADWCEACGNKQVAACQVHIMARELAALGVDAAKLIQPGSSGIVAGASADRSSEQKLRGPGMIFVWCLLSVVIAAVLAGMGFLVARRFRQARRQQQQQEHDAAAGDWQGPYV